MRSGAEEFGYIPAWLYDVDIFQRSTFDTAYRYAGRGSVLLSVRAIVLCELLASAHVSENDTDDISKDLVKLYADDQSVSNGLPVRPHT